MVKTTVQAKRSGNASQRSPLQLFLALLVAAAVLGYILSARHFADMHTMTIQNQQNTPAITSARGETIFIDINLGVSGSSAGEWASPSGVQLMLDGVSTPLKIVDPSQPYWGDTYTTGGQPKDIDITGTVTLPTSLGGPDERQLPGEIMGQIVTAGPFGNDSQDLSIPVQLHLLSGGSYLWSGGLAFLDGFAALTFLLFVGWLISGIRFVTLITAIPVTIACVAVDEILWGDIQIFTGGFAAITNTLLLFVALLVLSLLLKWSGILEKIQRRSGKQPARRTVPGKITRIVGLLPKGSSAELNALIAQGEELIKQEKYQEAQQVYQQIQSMRPNDARVHYSKGMLLLQFARERRAEILQELEEAIKYAVLPADKFVLADAYYFKALLFMNNREYQEALPLLSSAIDLDPEHPVAKEMRNRILLEQRPVSSS